MAEPTGTSTEDAVPSRWNVEHIIQEESEPAAAASVVKGHAVLLVPDFASPEEVSTLLAAGREAAAEHDAAVMGPHAARLGVLPGRVRFHVPTKLDAAAQRVSESILARALAFLQARLPELGESMLGCAAAELRSLPEAPGLVFSQEEPAVNVYGVDGEFAPHEDNMDLTVLLPLSPPAAFTGGGTAFWPPELKDKARQGAKPTLVLAPPAGTALFFGGEVTHAGRPVVKGARSVWVASFSTKASKGSELRPPPADGASDGGTAPSVEEVDAFLAAVGVS